MAVTTRLMAAGSAALVALLVVVLISACTTTVGEAAGAVFPASSFADYQQHTVSELRARRAFQSTDYTAELFWNAPQEWRPTIEAGANLDKGILLVHGLGDSPWSFHDLAAQLASQGFLVRTVLLPGHGTHPQDLLETSVEQWRQVVRQQTLALQRDVGEVYLGGFSTGANLVLEVAYDDPRIAGLLLFSPGFRASSGLAWLAPLATSIRPWVVAPGERVAMQNSVRYLNTPMNGFAQFYYSSRTAQRLLYERAYDKPVFMVVAQHDSVLDADYLLEVFQERFTHPASRLVWYGDAPAKLTDTARVLVREDRLPERRISQFSHMGLLFSPSNPLYGEQGTLRMCWNGHSQDAMRLCEQGAPVWYSDWGYAEEGKVHARLTFNPYFDWQTSVMATVLGSRGAPLAGRSDARPVSSHSLPESPP